MDTSRTTTAEAALAGAWSGISQNPSTTGMTLWGKELFAVCPAHCREHFVVFFAVCHTKNTRQRKHTAKRSMREQKEKNMAKNSLPCARYLTHDKDVFAGPALQCALCRGRHTSKPLPWVKCPLSCANSVACKRN